MANAGAIRAGRAFVEIFADDAALNKGLKKARGRLNRFAKSTASIRGGLTSAFTDAKKAVDSLASSLTVVGTQLGLLAGLAGLGLASSFKEYKDFETQMLTVQGILGSTSQDMEDLIERAKELGRTTSFSATEVAEGMTQLARAGRTQKQIWNDIAPAMDLARGTMIGMDQSVNMIVKTLNQFGLGADQARRVADTLAAGANSATTDIVQLGEALKFVGAFGNNLGISLEEVVATLDILADKGLNATIAGTQLARVLKELSKQDKQKRLKDMFGVDVEQGGKFIGLKKIFEEINKELGKMGDVEGLGKLEKLFGRGTTVALALAKSGGEIATMTKNITEQRGASEDLRHVIESGLFGAWEKLISAMKSVQQEFTQQLQPILVKTMDVFTKLTRSVSRFVASSATASKTVLKWVVGLSAFAVATLSAGVSLRVMSASIGSIFSLLQVALLPVTVSLKILVGLLAVGLVGALITAQAALLAFNVTSAAVTIIIKGMVAGFGLLSTAVAVFSGVISTLAMAFPAAAILGGLALVVGGFFSLVALFKVVKTVLVELSSSFKTLGVNTVRSLGDIKTSLVSAFNNVTFKKNLDVMVEDATRAFGLIKSALLEGDFESAWAVFLSSAKLLWLDFIHYLDSNNITSAFSGVYSKLKETVKLLVVDLKVILQELIDTANLVASIWDGLTKSVFEEVEPRFDPVYTDVMAATDRAKARRDAKADNKEAAKDKEKREQDYATKAKRIRENLAALEKKLADAKAANEEKRLRAAEERQKKLKEEAARLFEENKRLLGKTQTSTGVGGSAESKGSFAGNLARQILVASKATTLENLAEDGNKLTAETNRILRSSGLTVGMA